MDDDLDLTEAETAQDDGPDDEDTPESETPTAERELAGIKHLMEQRWQEMSAEDAAKAYALLGRPDTPSGYRLELGGLDADPEGTGAFQQVAHEAGLLPDQANKLARWWAEHSKASQESQAGQAVDREDQVADALRSEWGGAYEQQLDAARRGLRALGGRELVDELKELGVISQEGITRSAALVRAFASYGKSISEDGFIAADGSGGHASFKLTPEQARAQIAVKRRDPSFEKAYSDGGHPDHAQAVAELQKLYQAAMDQ